MSTTADSSPTPGVNSPGGMWTPLNGDRSIYTYSFLGAIGFITAIVLFFMGRAYTRRRRFALRVQQALESGRLDRSIVDEIINLPSGALYLGRQKKPRKNKVKPNMYEVQLAGAIGLGPTSEDDEDRWVKKAHMGWNDITPIAVSRITPPIQRNPSNSSCNDEESEQADPVTFSVFIAMPSSSSSGYGKEAEGVIPDVCFGVAQLGVTDSRHARPESRGT
ncbi:40S ribosomal protein S14 [Ceratobasidium sp. AG-Ba]|nr:40S ribosomal protein S14 [Ceratobasidium sp. AG-Ba]